MKALRIIFVALIFISFQAHAEDGLTATGNTAKETFEQTKLPSMEMLSRNITSVCIM